MSNLFTGADGDRELVVAILTTGTPIQPISWSISFARAPVRNLNSYGTPTTPPTVLDRALVP